MGNYAGVDWASEKHDVVVQNEAGEELLTAAFAHNETGLRALCRALVRLQVELVAIERPDGLLVERLLDAGLRVLALATVTNYAAGISNEMPSTALRAMSRPSNRLTKPRTEIMERLEFPTPAGRPCEVPRRPGRSAV